MILNVFANGRNSVPSAAQTRILWINDGGIFNEGSLKADGIDWSVSYDADLGDWGAWNTGVVGTYYLHRTSKDLLRWSEPVVAFGDGSDPGYGRDFEWHGGITPFAEVLTAAGR